MMTRFESNFALLDAIREHLLCDDQFDHFFFFDSPVNCRSLNISDTRSVSDVIAATIAEFFVDGVVRAVSFPVVEPERRKYLVL